MSVEIVQFSSLHIDLVEQERSYELETVTSILHALQEYQLQKIGFALVSMKVIHVEPWIGRHQLVTISAQANKRALSNTSLKTGDPVQIIVPENVLASRYASKKERKPPSGVIREMANNTMTIVVSPGCCIPRSYTGYCTVKKDVSQVMYDRICAALKSLASYNNNKRPRLHDVLFRNAEPSFDSADCCCGNKSFFDSSLNTVQELAVHKALSAREIAMIHGPPGTGKTHVLVEVIRQLASQGKKLLVCGASNVSVDNIAERLGNAPELTFRRFGNPARMRPSVIKYSFYGREQEQNASKQMVDLEAMFDKLSVGAPRKQAGNPASVVLATLCGSGDKKLKQQFPHFDVVIIDEASQATEGECWIAAIQAEKLILAGDHHQLPPTVKSLGKSTGTASKNNSKGGHDMRVLEKSMFERVQALLGEQVCVMLTTQYRMHKLIMEIPSNALYDKKLVPGPGVANHLLADMSGIQSNAITTSALVLIDTSRHAYAIEKSDISKNVYLGKNSKPIFIGGSKKNTGEVSLVEQHVARLVSYGMAVSDIAIITPYAGQVRLLKLALSKKYLGISIGTVDGFQGLEKEAVILSFVRSNTKQLIGFLKDYRRINVAITRARRHMCIIANKQTVGGNNKFLKSVFEYMDKHACKLNG
ncbi:hypothetical protein H4217_006082 [Coemansia sp. RSA 1939]|nr:hypothetical protein H4217_006082 [Coemansia sp. RSA 1939]KAJ2607327.1 hypothetical protein EV177_005580 [Coemansia sp. RSA 1804]